jgi:hypothetical protein
MHTDAFMEIGATHLVCEDYARGVTVQHKGEPLPLAVLSDGCSSSPDTDLGSRLLTWTAIQEISWAGPAIQVSVVAAASEQAAQAGALTPQSLDATLGVIVPDEGMIRVILVGDGVLSARRRDGVIETWLISFEAPNGQGAPGYLTYLRDSSRWHAWTQLDDKRESQPGFWNTRKVTRYLDGVLQDTESLEIKERAQISMHLLLNPLDYAFIAVFSDGVESFQRRGKEPFRIPLPASGAVDLPRQAQDTRVVNEGGRSYLVGDYLTKTLQPVSVHEVLKHCMAIKGSRGKFVTRRCRKFLNRFCTRNGWQHFDDFSMAALWTGDAQPEEAPGCGA